MSLLHAIVELNDCFSDALWASQHHKEAVSCAEFQQLLTDGRLKGPNTLPRHSTCSMAGKFTFQANHLKNQCCQGMMLNSRQES